MNVVILLWLASSAGVCALHLSQPSGHPLQVSRRGVFATQSAGVLALGISLEAAAATTSKNIVDSAKLSNGDMFPLASFGLQVYDDETAQKLTKVALEVGYRNFFASVLAGNQRGFARAVKESGVPREELYICGSVVSNRAKGFDEAYAATKRGWEQNLGAFAAGNIQTLDQIMLDYPGRDPEAIRGQWRAFEDMHAKGLVKSLSVSNFSPQQLDVILNDPATTVRPVVNQLPYSVAFHPGSVKENEKRGLLVQAWAPLGYSLGSKFTPAMQSTCASIGTKYGKTYAQVALRWVVQRGAAFTCQTSSRKHFEEDLDVFDFALDAKDMAILDALAPA